MAGPLEPRGPERCKPLVTPARLELATLSLEG